MIPADLYEAVAQLLAFVFGLRAKGRAAGYHELPKRRPPVTTREPRPLQVIGVAHIAPNAPSMGDSRTSGAELAM